MQKDRKVQARCKPEKRIQMKFYGSLLSILFFLPSCGRYMVVTGTVLDKETKAPVENVSVDVSRLVESEVEFREETDRNGYFRLSLVKELKKYRYILAKDGYKTLKLKSVSDSIYLERSH